ncbi:hypothetical protein [Aeromonas simiae]|uniref:hypothetical protein n=1 Tax=Aeromonas simiae TaxID=218936 RepID=UPI00266D9A5D|nr:hypothetical protein [Aeromonas simiae]MDO2948684.1 hypothetical protein [Aeromonas simiae]MDO2952159.1 hypothetical protein [Aeromonas simiae]MDO2956067.1 hypothetical protein [Aeromonas simiae]
MTLNNPLPFWRRYFRIIGARLHATPSDPAQYLTQLMQWDLSWVDEEEYRQRM